MISSVAITATAGLLMTLSSLITQSAFAQTPYYYQNPVDGFSIQVPNGWIVDDLNNTAPDMQSMESELGIGLLARLCPQEDSLPDIGGGSKCQQGESRTVIHIFRYDDLYSRVAFFDYKDQSKTITIADMLAFHFTSLQNEGYTDFTIINDTDTTVNVTDAQTNQTVGTASAKLLYYSYPVSFSAGSISKDLVLLVLDNDDGNTGYYVIPSFPLSSLTGPPTWQTLPPQIKQVIDSFGLVK
jgi:hypothetical protein